MLTLITGANGLLGRALCSELEHADHRVIRIVRKSTTPWEISVGDLNEHTQWGEVLGARVDVVVHLAGQVPVSSKATDWKSDLFYQTNALGTRNLANQCAQYGVKRFVFVSTVKVLGDGKDEPYKGTDLAVPSDVYAISKWEAEQMLWQIAAKTSMEVVILRPPLVYGPGVKGNFLDLMQAIDRCRPLPLGAIQNQRSLIYLGNLIDAIRLCLTHPKAAGKTYLVSDGDDVSTPELVRRIAAALWCRPLLLPLPVSWMRWAGRVLGKQASVDRVLRSLCVDISPLRVDLGWEPPYTMQEGLEATAQWYRKTKAVV